MDADQIERFFFRSPTATAAERAATRRQSSELYRSPRVLAEQAPFHLDLSAVIPSRAKAIADARKLVFHFVGDTGGVNGTDAQVNVADHMTPQIHDTSPLDQPSFCFHLGDVVYYHGQWETYHDHFYGPDQRLPGPDLRDPREP
jgi:hypothetical protein